MSSKKRLSSNKNAKHDPLFKDENQMVNKKERKKVGREKKREERKENESFIPSDLSGKILTNLRAQQQENDENVKDLNDIDVELYVDLEEDEDEPNEKDEKEYSFKPGDFFKELNIDYEDERALHNFMNKSNFNKNTSRTINDMILDKIMEKDIKKDNGETGEMNDEDGETDGKKRIEKKFNGKGKE
eukprot:TRINITY_DN5604_c0_g1_i2.p1 TRINITY_DN5604_c0_g1~~TRINITY_DN5604_c0_g1_i2.p1  ORF type:complete len:201 (-),score=84.03 TRINITY_DN5604_c0_g1_i2:204-764(-)